MNSAIVLVVDRLGAGFLGPYGNTWLETPHINRLAAQSLVCETAWADSPNLEMAYRAMWTGRHALEPAADATAALAARAARSGARTVLITDDESVARHSLAATFGEQLLVESPTSPRAALSIDETNLFRFMAAAIEAIDQAREPLLACIHARGMTGPWDAPREFRERFVDLDDPSPPDLLVPPERRLDRHADPDEILGLVQAYAGQVQVADESLGMLLDALDQRPQRDQTLLAVTAPRGYPLGEHGRVGPCDEALYSELVQVPLLVRLSGQEGRLVRTQRIVQTSSLYTTIIEACGWGELTDAERGTSLLRDARGEEASGRASAVAIAPGQRAIRTPAWQMRESNQESETRVELFAKPDDRWEANEVSSLCGEVSALLAAELDQFEQTARAGQLAELAPPPELLLDCWR